MSKVPYEWYYALVGFFGLVELSMAVFSPDSSEGVWIALSEVSETCSYFSCACSSDNTSLLPAIDKGLIKVTVSSLPYCANFCSRFSLKWNSSDLLPLFHSGRFTLENHVPGDRIRIKTTNEDRTLINTKHIGIVGRRSPLNNPLLHFTFETLRKSIKILPSTKCCKNSVRWKRPSHPLGTQTWQNRILYSYLFGDSW